MSVHFLVERSEDLGAVAEAIRSSPVIGLDTETTGLDPHTSKLRIVSVNTGDRSYVIDVFKCGALGVVGDALREHAGIQVLQNAKFDCKFLQLHAGVELPRIFDTLRASRILHTGVEGMKHGLYDLYERELGVVPDAPDMGGSDWSGPLTASQYAYAAEDVQYLHRLRDSLRPKLLDAGLQKIAQLEFACPVVEAAMELNGLRFDRDAWLQVYEVNRAASMRLRDELFRELPHPRGQTALFEAPSFNLASPDQVMASLRRAGIKAKGTAELDLAPLAGEFPVLSKLIEYKKLNKACSSFGPAYLDQVNRVTGRIHTSYWAFTDTGRYSSSNPNLQNLPRGKAFRACVRPAPGHVFVIVDLSQVELRMMAQLSRDPRLIQVYARGEDAHKQTAAIVNAVPLDTVTKDMRQKAKAVNFGFCIAEGQRVLTNEGLVPIESVRLDHLVWDGAEWVTHGGVVYMGVRRTVEYDGIRATPDHVIYTSCGWKVPIGRLASKVCGGFAAIGAVGSAPVRYESPVWCCRAAFSESSLCGAVVYGVQAHGMGVGGQRVVGEESWVSVLATDEVRKGSACGSARRSVRLYGAALYSDDTSNVEALLREGYSSGVRVPGGVYPLGVGAVARGAVCWQSVRSDRQQWALCAVESEAGYASGKPEESRVLSRVYDIVNAGPRHRFTVEGRVVSNCYGMGAEKFVLYALMNYGARFTLDEARRVRERYFEGYAGVAAWHKYVLREVKPTGESRSLWGRRRYLGHDLHTEWFNTPDQSSCADGLKAALILTYQRMRAHGSKVRMVHMVHDEIILEVVEEPGLPEQVTKELIGCMEDALRPMLTLVPSVAEGGWGHSWAEK